MALSARLAACWSCRARTVPCGGALFGLGKGDGEYGALGFGALAKALPEGDWHFAAKLDDPTLAAIGLELGSYQFTRYGKKPGRALRIALPKGADAARVERVSRAVFLTRDLINTPTNDMGPSALEEAARASPKSTRPRFR